jgi:hypothetical protein
VNRAGDDAERTDEDEWPPAELAAASDLVCLCAVGHTDVEEVGVARTACWLERTQAA